MCPYLPFSARKTTLTEKLLLFGGAIQLAGEVKARGERRRVRSDWMAVERERGISVSGESLANSTLPGSASTTTAAASSRGGTRHSVSTATASGPGRSA